VNRYGGPDQTTSAVPATGPACGDVIELRALPLTIGGGAVVAAVAMARRRSSRAAVASGVAIAVAAVPQGLPLVANVAQLAAARRLTRRGVLVRNLRALEALGRIDTFYFEKTGTLTQNRLEVTQVTDAFCVPVEPDGTAALLFGRLLSGEAPRAGEPGGEPPPQPA
jgi:cation-transporting ATPase I